MAVRGRANIGSDQVVQWSNEIIPALDGFQQAIKDLPEIRNCSKLFWLFQIKHIESDSI
jgi:hypothetical protein